MSFYSEIMWDIVWKRMVLCLFLRCPAAVSCSLPARPGEEGSGFWSGSGTCSAPGWEMGRGHGGQNWRKFMEIASHYIIYILCFPLFLYIPLSVCFFCNLTSLSWLKDAKKCINEVFGCSGGRGVCWHWGTSRSTSMQVVLSPNMEASVTWNMQGMTDS